MERSRKEEGHRVVVMRNQGCTSGCRRASVLPALVFALVFPSFVVAAPTIPAGVGPLPDLASGAKGGAIVTAQRLADYRAILPTEVADLVEQGELTFEVALNPATQGLADGSGAPSSAPPEVSGGGDPSPLPVSVSGPLFAARSGDDDGSLQLRGYQILWNSATPVWRERSAAADLAVTIFKSGMSEFKRVDFAVERIYPQALGVSPGTLHPLFREKISGRTPPPIAGLTWLTLRFLGSSADDYVWSASPVTGDVMQMTASARGDSVFTDAFAPDDLFVWSGKVEGVSPVRVSEATLLVPMIEGIPQLSKAECSVTDLSKANGVQLNALTKRFPAAGHWVPTSVRFIPRSVFRVEVTSRDLYSRDAHQVIYVDSATSLPVYRVVYGQDARLRKVVIGLIGSLPLEGSPQLAWRGQVIVNAETGGRTVLALNRYERCPSLKPGRAIIDFDPSTIGLKQVSDVKKKGRATPTPVPDAEPVDE